MEIEPIHRPPATILRNTKQPSLGSDGCCANSLISILLFSRVAAFSGSTVPDVLEVPGIQRVVGALHEDVAVVAIGLNEWNDFHAAPRND
jgi:hypothetical protein